ncbi:MAG TPA: hypothetical protein VFA46_07205 [Actinomycetes bacterium]|nr:hypothetical protein [Actinomycetes bacterium]
MFRITSAVEADGSLHNPREQVEANKLSFLQAPADGEVVPVRGVADVLERVLVLVGPEVMNVVVGAAEPSIDRAAAAPCFSALL